MISEDPRDETATRATPPERVGGVAQKNWGPLIGSPLVGQSLSVGFGLPLATAARAFWKSCLRSSAVIFRCG